MFLKSLQWRLVCIFILLTFFLIAPISLFLNKKIESWYYKGFKTGIENGFDNWPIKNDSKLDEMLRYLNQDKNAITQFLVNEYKSYTVVDSNQISDIVYSSDKYYDEGKSKTGFVNEIIASENLITVMAGSAEGRKNKLVHINGRDYFDYARAVALADGKYVIYFRYVSDAWQKDIDDFNKYIFTSLLILIVISLVLGYILSKTITIPIVRVMHKARSLAAGDFGQVLEVKSEDEIGQLTKAFNYMANSLKNTMIEISNEKSKIETILNYMTDGVIAYNLKGELIHVNSAAGEILDREEFNGTFDEFAEKYGISIALEEILYLEAFKSKEMNIISGEKCIRVYFAVFTDEAKKPGGIIAVLQDITEQQKLENMRREFVANVSHELRTPLTSIKSYAETLLDGVRNDGELSEKFLGVINSEADRMTRLVRDLLQLSRLDNSQMQWNMQESSFVELVRRSVEKMQIEAENKGQKLECHVIGKIPAASMDRDRIEQVVLNVLSNAIKYTPEGGTIAVYIGKTHNEVYMKVADNGIGIPKDDLPRIFERFYRVDKARSREMGGTGLGLSIAREIVQAHSGEIAINSELGKGTEVIVKLPVT